MRKADSNMETEVLGTGNDTTLRVDNSTKTEENGSSQEKSNENSTENKQDEGSNEGQLPNDKKDIPGSIRLAYF